jgi:hypothetical protein
MSEMYADPPHLTVAVYSAEPEITTFARMCDVVRDLGCDPRNLVEVAPVDRDFELLADLGDARMVQEVDPARLTQLVQGQDPSLRVIRAAYSHREFGKVIVRYVLREGSGPHPIGVTVSAGPYGLPEEMWSASMRRCAYAMDGWTRNVMQAAAARCHPLYGAIGVEFSLSPPEELIAGGHDLSIELFVSRHLLDADISLDSKLRAAFSGGEVTNWDEGTFYSGWAYDAQRASVRDTTFTVRAAASALATALRTYSQSQM